MTQEFDKMCERNIEVARDGLCVSYSVCVCYEKTNRTKRQSVKVRCVCVCRHSEGGRCGDREGVEGMSREVCVWYENTDRTERTSMSDGECVCVSNVRVRQ
jgi:hypothetical protein